LVATIREVVHDVFFVLFSDPDFIFPWVESDERFLRKFVAYNVANRLFVTVIRIARELVYIKTL